MDTLCHRYTTVIAVFFRFPNQGRQVDDLEIFSHTNETLGSVRRQILQRLKGNPTNVKLELFLNADVIDTADDRKILLVRNRNENVFYLKKCTYSGDLNTKVVWYSNY